jgi:hypothetical protein
MFGFKKKNETWKVSAEDAAACVEANKEASKKAEELSKELDEKLKPFREVKTKGEVIISTLYRRHDIPITTCYRIDDTWLDFEVIKDLCVFSEQEIAVLEKWIPKYKEAVNAQEEILNNFSREP